MISETSRCRENLLKFCGHNGIDIGYGGDPIKPEAIAMDMPEPYTSVGKHEQNLRGSAKDLYWFKDNVLDYVFSSHLLEDFSEKEIPKILKEWLRVIKPGGHLVLYLPNQKRYLKCCKDNDLPDNENHKVDMSLELMKDIIKEYIPNGEVVHAYDQKDPIESYSFEFVIKKL